MTHRRSPWGCLLAAPILALFAPLAVTAQTATETIKGAPAYAAKQLAAAPTDGWITNGGSLFNQRYSPLTLIDRANIGDLKAVWRTHLNGAAWVRSTPARPNRSCYDGVLYMVTGEDDVFAISVDTGKILWSYEAKLDLTGSKCAAGG